MPIRMNGETGTPAWCARENTRNLERIANSLEVLAKWCENNSRL